MRAESRSQSEVIGVVLLIGVVVTVVFTASVFILPTILSGADDPLLSIEAEASLQNVTITHAGGDTVDADDVQVFLEGEDTERYELTSFTQVRGNDNTVFEKGDRWSRSHGIDADRMEILVVHTPTNTVVRETVEVTDTLAPRFDWNTTTTTTLDTVEFDASESRYEEGEITSYEWEILDGGENFATSSGEQVTHSFSDPGTYQVRLTIQTGDGRSATRTRTIEVFSPPPQAAFTYEPAAPKSGDQVTFNASDSESPDGSIVSYSWEFGDGNTSTGEEVDHTYANPGTYTVTLTVTDDDGETVSKSRGITVGAQPPSFNVSIDDVDDPVVVGETLTVDVTVENTGGTSDTQDVTLAVNGTDTETQSVTLDGGATANLSFTYDTDFGDLPALALNVSSDDDFATETVTVKPRIRIFNARPGASNSIVDFDVENNGGSSVTIEGITLNDTSSTATLVDNGGNDELTFTGGGRLNAGTGNDGIEIGTTRYNLDVTETLSGDSTTTGTLAEFDDGGGPGPNMVGETVTVTLHLSNGESYTETLTVDTRPYFAVEIDGTNSPIETDGDVAVQYTVTNIGEETGTQDIRVTFEGEEGEVQQTQLSPDESDQNTLQYSLNGSFDPGEYTVTIHSDNESESTTVDVIEQGASFLEVNITGTNEPVSEGDTLTVTADVTNTGESEVTDGEITLDIDGVGVVNSTTVSVPTDETETVTLEWQTGTGDAGEYQATVASQNTTDSTAVEVKDGPFFLGLTAEVTDSRGGGTEADEVTVEYNLSENVGDVTITIEDDTGRTETADGADTPTTGGTLHAVALSFGGGGGPPMDNYPIVVTVDIQGGECYTVELTSASDRATLASNDWEAC